MATNKPEESDDVDFNWESEPTPIYSNMIYVQTLIDSFALYFASISPARMIKREGSDKEYLDAPIVASLRIPPHAYLGLMETMVDVWNANIKLSDDPTLKKYKLIEDKPTKKKTRNGDG